MIYRLATFCTTIATAAALTASPLALAHGPHSTDMTLQHYLTSPDHVMTMIAVAAMVLGTGLWAARRSAVTVRRKKR